MDRNTITFLTRNKSSYTLLWTMCNTTVWNIQLPNKAKQNEYKCRDNKKSFRYKGNNDKVSHQYLRN